MIQECGGTGPEAFWALLICVHSALFPLQPAATMCDSELGSDKVKEVGDVSMEHHWYESWYEKFVQPCLVELLGSALFIFIGCLSVIGNEASMGLLQPALAHGLALGLLIATLGNIRWVRREHLVFCWALGWKAMLLAGTPSHKCSRRRASWRGNMGWEIKSQLCCPWTLAPFQT